MPQKGLSGSTLKLIAIITMLIDHIGAAVIARLLIAGQGSEMLYKSHYATGAYTHLAQPTDHPGEDAGDAGSFNKTEQGEWGDQRL